VSVALAATLVGSSDPQKVILSITGMTTGASWSIAASTAGASWTVPGAQGVSNGSTVTLVDDRCPTNQTVNWALTVNGAIAATATLTVPCGSPMVLTSLDGATVAAIDLASGELPRTGSPRVAVVRPAGRGSGIPFSDIAGGDSWKWDLEVDGPNSALLDAMLGTGKPLVMRSSPGYGDLSGTVILQPTAWDSSLLSPLSRWRTWHLSAEEIDEPEPSTAQVAFSWDYIDALGLTWDQFDALALTWDQLDAFDWSTLA